MKKEEIDINGVPDFTPNLFWGVGVEDLDMGQHKAFIGREFESILLSIVIQGYRYDQD